MLITCSNIRYLWITDLLQNLVFRVSYRLNTKSHLLAMEGVRRNAGIVSFYINDAHPILISSPLVGFVQSRNLLFSWLGDALLFSSCRFWSLYFRGNPSLVCFRKAIKSRYVRFDVYQGRPIQNIDPRNFQ